MSREKTSPSKGLSARQLKFVNAYFATNLNAAKALKIAGYSDKTHSATVLLNPKVVAYIEDQAKKVMDKMEITAERLMAEMCKIAHSDIRDVVECKDNTLSIIDFDELDPSAAAIQSVAIRPTKYGKVLSIKMHDKVRAISQLAQWAKLGQPGEGVNLQRIKTNVPHHEPLPE